MKYTEEHEWLRIEDDLVVVGITDHASAQLGDVVFVEMPEAGKTVSQGDEAGVVESVKAASEVYAPVSGEVVEANPELEDNPALVNQDPLVGGWFFRLRLSDAGELDGLMDEAAYKAYIEELD